MESQAIIENINRLFSQAQQLHQKMQRNLNDTAKQLDSNDSLIVLEAHQLTLQLRLDTQDLVKQLLAMNQGYCQVIGIEPQNSSSENLSKMLELLNKGHLQQSLILLIGLINQMKKTLLLSKETLKQQQKEFGKLRKLLKKLGLVTDKLTNSKRLGMRLIGDDKGISPSLGRTHKHQTGALLSLHEAIDVQTHLKHCIELLTEALQVAAGSPKAGAVYDYLIRIQGPISRFFQAIISGVGTSETLHNWCQLKLGADTPEAPLNQLHNELNKQLLQVNQMQQQLSKQTAQQNQLLSQANEQLNQALTTNSPTQAQAPQKLQNESTARRMLDLFNRK